MAPACSTCPSWWLAAPPSARHDDRAVARDAEVIHQPREFPEYGEHYATYFLDPHGIMLEVVCHSTEEA